MYKNECREKNKASNIMTGARPPAACQHPRERGTIHTSLVSFSEDLWGKLYAEHRETGQLACGHTGSKQGSEISNRQVWLPAYAHPSRVLSPTLPPPSSHSSSPVSFKLYDSWGLHHWDPRSGSASCYTWEATLLLHPHRSTSSRVLTSQPHISPQQPCHYGLIQQEQKGLMLLGSAPTQTEHIGILHLGCSPPSVQHRKQRQCLGIDHPSAGGPTSISVAWNPFSLSLYPWDWVFMLFYFICFCKWYFSAYSQKHVPRDLPPLRNQQLSVVKSESLYYSPKFSSHFCHVYAWTLERALILSHNLVSLSVHGGSISFLLLQQNISHT